jgi:hypothetical protein
MARRSVIAPRDHGGSEPAVEHQGHQAGVAVEVLKLAGDVPVVHIDRDGPDLEAGQHGLDVLGAVGQLRPDPVTGPDAGGDQVVGEPVGPLVELGIREPALPRDHGLDVADLVGDALEQVRQIQLHRRPLPWARKRTSGPYRLVSHR